MYLVYVAGECIVQSASDREAFHSDDLLAVLISTRQTAAADTPPLPRPGSAVSNTQGDVTSQNLWSRYDRHFVGVTRYNVLS